MNYHGANNYNKRCHPTIHTFEHLRHNSPVKREGLVCINRLGHTFLVASVGVGQTCSDQRVWVSVSLLTPFIIKKRAYESYRSPSQSHSPMKSLSTNLYDAKLEKTDLVATDSRYP